MVFFISGLLSGCVLTLKDVGIVRDVKEGQFIVSSISTPLEEFPLVINDEVLDELSKLKRSPYSIKKWLLRSQEFAFMMKGIFRRYSIPEELFYVAILESGFNTDTISVKGAGGPWQFIPGTARKMGMRIDTWVDERRDYEKSTTYAAKYFRYFYDSFSDWYLALAGYNCGGAPVRRALKELGDVSIWEMAENGRLRYQAGGYVPRVIALVMIMEEPEKFGFEAPEGIDPFTYDKVYVPGGLPLTFLADVLGIKVKVLKRLNPELLMEMTPPDVTDYELKIPAGKKREFVSKFYHEYEKSKENLRKWGQAEEPEEAYY